MKGRIAVLSFAAVLFCTILVSHGQDRNRLDGHWKLIKEKSASIDPWSDLTLEIQTSGTQATIVKRYSAGHPLDRRVDSMTVDTRGKEEIIPVPSGRWLGQVSMGVYYGPTTKRYVQARMSDPANKLQVDSRETVQTAQGAVEVRVKETYTLTSDGSTIQWNETRSTRTSGPPLPYTFSRIAQ